MGQLHNFPIVNQLADTNEVNREFDCVPSSIAAGLEYLTGKKFSGAELKDAVYGPGYQGGTAAVMYVEYCAKQGVRLYPVSGSNSYLAQQAHSLLAKGQPVVFTQPDPYDSAPGMSHVCVLCADTPNSFTYMDPFGGKFLTVSETTLIHMFLFGQIWPMQKVEGATVNVPQGWHDDGKTLTAPNGVPVVLGFRQFVLAHNWPEENYPLGPEYSIAQLEVSNPSLGSGTQQIFRWSMLGYDKERGVFEEWLGQELSATRKRAADLYAQLVLAEKNKDAQYGAIVTQLQSQLAQAQADAAKAQADYQSLTKSIATLFGAAHLPPPTLPSA